MALSHVEMLYQVTVRNNWRRGGKKDKKEREWGLRKRRTVKEHGQKGGEREIWWKGEGSGRLEEEENQHVRNI